MRARLRTWLLTTAARIQRWLTPQADPIPELRKQNKFLGEKLSELMSSEIVRQARESHTSMVSELVEAMRMTGSGPWTISPATIRSTNELLAAVSEAQPGQPITLKETTADGAIGATGDINLMLATVEWRRDINMSWLQFSRWGIQQIILIARLYYVKNPIVRRLIDVCAAYVFARGVEVTTNDEKANDVLKDFFARNKNVLGQNALVECEKRKDYDGNLFWACFADKEDTGLTDVRLIDATEMQDIITDPEDADTPWFYRRCWTQRNFDAATGIVSSETRECWYPALNYEPTVKPTQIQSKPVVWETAIHHRKCGYVGRWLFGCPRAFPMLDWSREARKYLEACASVAQSLMQYAMLITVKGGQQAMAGMKQQLGTTVGPQTPVWDTNPTAVSGATAVSGPGTEIKAFNTQGAGMDPEKVRQYKLMCAMTAGVPETFLADVSTGNLATATSLDRPTETGFLEKQESWREDLIVLSAYALKVSKKAPSGRLLEVADKDVLPRAIRECGRKRGPRGEVVYEAFKPKDEGIEIQVNFPAIREGDQKAQMEALALALTLGNRGGQIIGIDEKQGIKRAAEIVEMADPGEMVEEMYPEGKYTADRTEQILDAPIKRAEPPKGGAPQIDPKTGRPTNPAPPPNEEVQEALKRIHEATAPYAHNGK